MPKSKPLDIRNQIDMFPATRGRGRPRKADALSNAERQHRYRQRMKERQAKATVSTEDDLVFLLGSMWRDILSAQSLAKSVEARYGVQAELEALQEVLGRASHRIS
jgi:hypothetical protein